MCCGVNTVGNDRDGIPASVNAESLVANNSSGVKLNSLFDEYFNGIVGSDGFFEDQSDLAVDY